MVFAQTSGQLHGNKDHSLEVHEKPTSNTITLLETQGVKIDPRSGVYLFRVVDDGSNVALTIIDPSNPDVEMSISTETKSNLDEGFIGFESCWGSPILLEDVRIFRSQPSK